MNCRICGASLRKIDSKAYVCDQCRSLHNAHASLKAYTGNGEGQSIPSIDTRNWRLLNAEFRFKILAPYLSDIKQFVDIGCGSGEMLYQAQKLGMEAVGFDTNVPLVVYAQEEFGLNAIPKSFSVDLLPKNEKRKLFAISHVIEHLECPLSFLRLVSDAMDTGDLLYIEVPLFTGESFKIKGYNWSLWYEEHFELFSLKTLEFIANALDMTSLDIGTRIFSRGSVSKGLVIKLFKRYPMRVLLRIFSRDKRLSVADILMADYGWIVLKKNKIIK